MTGTCLTGLHGRKARVSLAAALLAVPLSCFAQVSVCDLLTEGKPPEADLNAPAPPANPPDVRELIVQVYTTRGLDDLETEISGNHFHKCALAQDLAAVDVMMDDIGFGGFDGMNAPLVASAYVEYVGDPSRQKIIRDAAGAIQGIGGDPELALETLKNDDELYDERVMNLYFVHFPEVEIGAGTGSALPVEIRGMHLRNEEGMSEKIIFYGDGALSGTLVHEFGHALSLGHVNFWDLDGKEWCAKYLPEPSTPQSLPTMECEFERNNIMWAGSTADRTALGDPQKERVMHNVKSVIAEFSPSTAPLDCPDFRTAPGAGCNRLVQ